MEQNLHIRELAVPPSVVAPLVDGLSSAEDRMWPAAWPPMRFDGPLAVGALGGHGPIGYVVELYEPGRLVRFRFVRPTGFVGTHSFLLEEADRPDRSRLQHLLEMRTVGLARITWPLLFRPMHDALVEDALDQAERATTGSVDDPARWSPWVRLLRRATRTLLRPRERIRSAA